MRQVDEYTHVSLASALDGGEWASFMPPGPIAGLEDLVREETIFDITGTRTPISRPPSP
jgi:hypothetical protein